MGTGPAPMRSSGSDGRIESSGARAGGGTGVVMWMLRWRSGTSGRSLPRQTRRAEPGARRARAPLHWRPGLAHRVASRRAVARLGRVLHDPVAAVRRRDALGRAHARSVRGRRRDVVARVVAELRPVDDAVAAVGRQGAVRIARAVAAVVDA